MKRTLLLIAVIATAFSIRLSAQQAQWLTQTGCANTAISLSAALDSSDNVYSAGFFTGTVDFGFGPLAAQGLKDIFILKQSPAGAVLWARTYGGTLDEEIRGLCISSQGILYAAGNMQSANIAFGNVTLSDASPQTEDAFLLACDLGGNTLWARQSHGSGDECATAVAATPSGGTCIVGHYLDTLVLGSAALAAYGSRDMFIAYYDASGAFMSADHAGGIYDDAAYGIAIDSTSALYATGYCNLGPAQSASAAFGDSTLSVSGYTDIFAVKYDTSLQCLWVRGTGGGSMDEGFGIASAYGKLFVTGLFSGQCSFGITTISTASTADAVVLAYDQNGNELWAKQLGSAPSGTSLGYGVTVDPFGNPIVVGAFEDTAASPKLSLSSRGDYDMFIIRLDNASGMVLWSDSAGGTDEDWATAVACDGSGNIYATGTAASPVISLDALSVTTNPGQMDGFVAKFGTVTAVPESTPPGTMAAFPNPFTDNIQIRLPEGVYRISLTDPLGRELRRVHSGGSVVIDRQGLPSGIYLLAVYSNDSLVGAIKVIAQ